MHSFIFPMSYSRCIHTRTDKTFWNIIKCRSCQSMSINVWINCYSCELIRLWKYFSVCSDIFLNLINLNQILITITIFQSIWYQMEFCLVPNQSEKGNYNRKSDHIKILLSKVVYMIWIENIWISFINIYSYILLWAISWERLAYPALSQKWLFLSFWSKEMPNVLKSMEKQKFWFLWIFLFKKIVNF